MKSIIRKVLVLYLVIALFPYAVTPVAWATDSALDVGTASEVETIEGKPDESKLENSENEKSETQDGTAENSGTNVAENSQGTETNQTKDSATEKSSTVSQNSSATKATTSSSAVKVPKKVLKKWKKGFHKYKGNRYYCKRKGKLVKGWKTIKKKRYYFAPATGAAVKYHQTIKNKRYYFTGSGVMRTGWVEFKDGKRYYKKSGVMVTGVVTIKSKEYYFNPSTGLVLSSKYAYEIPVLTFHRITSDAVKNNYYANDEWVAKISDFKNQMKYLHDNGYKTLSMDEFYDWYANGKNVDKRSVVLTFDDGDYEFYHLVAPVLKDYSFKATMFVIGKWTTETTQEYEDSNKRARLGHDLIERMKTEYSDLNIQSHSWNLHYYDKDAKGNSTQVVYLKSQSELEEDFSMTDSNYKYMAWPYGKYSDAAVKAFNKSHYRLSFRFGSYKYSNGRYRKARRTDPKYAIYRLKVNGQITMKEFQAEVAVR